MSDLIDRQAAIDTVGNMLRRKFGIGGDLAKITLAGLPSTQPDVTDIKAEDMISRADVIELVKDSYYNLAESMEDTWAMVEDVEKLPSAQPEKPIRCKDCKWWGYDDDDGTVRVCHAAKHGHMSSNWSIMIYRTHKGDFYCADAERREGEADG